MNVLIVDSDRSFCKSMKKTLSNVDEIQIIECVNSNEKLSIVLKEKGTNYDVCLVDVSTIGSEFENINSILPNSNIIAFFERTKDVSKYINKSKIDRLFLKPIDAFSVYIYMKDRFNMVSQRQSIRVSKAYILDELTRIGFSLCHKGTIYLADACVKMSQNPNKKANEIYEDIGLNYNLSGNQVCWAINNALNKAIERDRTNKMTEYFCFYDGRRASVKYIMKFFATRFGECIN